MNVAHFLPLAIETLAKSTVLVLGALALIAAARRLSAAQQHAVWVAVFSALLLLPCTKLIAPRWQLQPVPVGPPVRVVSEAPVERLAMNQAPAQSAGRAEQQSHVNQREESPSGSRFDRLKTSSLSKEMPLPRSNWLLAPGSWYSAILPVAWFAGALGIIAYRLLGSLQIARLQRRCAEARDLRVTGLARTAAAEMKLRQWCPVRLSEAVRVPCTWGLWRPVILLPAEAEQWSDARLLAALRHECAHVARRDYLSRWVALLACALYWPNPLVWFAARRLYAVQERACDDLVLRAGTPATDYAALIFDTVSASARSNSALRAAVAMARPSTLEGRVLAIVDETRNRRPAGRFAAMTGVLGVVCIAVASGLAQVAPEKPASAAAPANQGKPQLAITAKFLEIRKAVLPVLPALVNSDKRPFGVVEGVLTEAQMTQMFQNLEPSHSVEVLSSTKTTMVSGRTGRIEMGRDYDLPLGSQPAKKFVGVSVEITPTVTDQVIELTATLRENALQEELTVVSGKPVISDEKVTTNISIFDRQAVLFSMGDARRPGWERVVLVEVQTLAVQPVAAITPAPTAHPLPSVVAANIVPPGIPRRRVLSPADGVPTPAPKPTAQQKAAKIIIPKIEFRDATIEECLAYLRQQARAISPDNEVNILFRPLKLPPNAEPPRITFSVANVSLLDAFQYVANQASLDFAVLPEALVLGAGDPDIIQTVSSKQWDRAGKIILPQVEFKEATVSEALDFVRAKAAELDPEKLGINLILKAGPGTDSKITLSLKNVSVAETVRFIASLSGLEVYVHPGALVIEPRGASASVRKILE